uniref:Transcription elongation factor SPT4 n=1 Tax=Homalodisca liturata TaxID=320908 RepID=A0A1B6J182_9HEMI
MGAAEGAAAGSSGRLRACMNCAIIKPSYYFKQHGCPNCPFLEIDRSKNLALATSSSFKGTIGLVDPGRSWVAKWQRLDGCVPGTYAMTVEGELSEALIEKIEQEGRVYFNRAASFELS